jgi:uncharacterized membrane-anchored protein
MTRKIALLLALTTLVCATPASTQQPTPEQQARIEQLTALQKSLHPITGDVAVPAAKATLHLGEDYYFLAAPEARRVLIEGWRNPPDAADGVLGMVFPAGASFMDDTWGAVISYDQMGWVSDEDAQSADYDEMLKEMQAQEDEVNAERSAQGYPAQHLVGWAQPPSYDRASHSVVWARNIQFQGSPENTLNYDVRLLGRHGVLSMNMITGMSKLAETREGARKFARSASFDVGARYADYKPGTDTKAEVGVAGLVAAGVGVAAAKKLGLLAILVAFGKKALVLIMAAGAAAFARLRRRHRGDEEEQYEPDDHGDYAAAEAAPEAEPLPTTSQADASERG